MLKLFDRYVIREVLPPFFIGLLIYTFVLLMNQLLLLSELFIARGVSLSVTIRLLVYILPSILAFTVPMSVLMGILAGLARLSSDSEITAFKTLGISHKRILWPLLVFAFMSWLGTSMLTLYLVPHFNYKWVQTVAKSVLDKVQLRINPREFNESIPSTVIFIQDIAQENDWENIFFFFSDSPGEPRVILARKGKLHFYPALKRATVELYDAVQHVNSLSDPDTYSVTSSRRIEEELKVESLYASFVHEKRVKEKNIRELLAGIQVAKKNIGKLEKERKDIEAAKLKKDDGRRIRNSMELRSALLDYRSAKIEIHKKFALAFVCLIFVFLGLPLGLSTKKGGRTSGFTISIVIILIYYVLITAGEKIAMDGRISPFLGMWGGNILFSLIGILLFLRSSRGIPLFPTFHDFFGRGRRDTAWPRHKKAARKWTRLSLPFPNILDRYIMRKYVAIFSLVFLSLIAISIIVTFFERMGNIYEHKKSISLLFDYIRFRIPEFIHFSLPVTALAATLLSMGILTKFNEVTAMKACGISLYRMILSLVSLSVLVGVLSFYIQERVLPVSNRKAEETWSKINNLPPRSYSYLNRRWVANKNRDRFYHYTYFDPKSAAFSHLSIFDIDFSSQSFRRRLYAEKAYLKGRTLHLENCWLRDFVGPRLARYEKKDSLVVPLEEGKGYFLREWREPAQMDFGELRQYIKEIREMGFDTVRFSVDLNYKISFPFVALIMTFLGAPFAFSMGKRGTLVGIGISLGIAMVYWIAIGVFRSLGYIGFLTPFLAAWGPNLIFGLIGLYLLFRLRT
ncbi:MAG: LptF/LptG family permease [Candidatus Aminicenantales bacterium]